MNLCMCASGKASPYGRWHKLMTILDLKSKDLMGSISSHVGNLSFLRTLDLLNNIFTSQIPPQILPLSRLTKLLLYSNTLRGPIPQIYISHCFGLQLLDLANNFLTGKVPTEVGLLSKLRVLKSFFSLVFRFGRKQPAWTHSNRLWKVPSFARSSKLKNLATQSNNLESREDDDLSIEENQLTGPIPSTIVFDYNRALCSEGERGGSLGGGLRIGGYGQQFSRSDGRIFHAI
ncbi:hypothetical protein FEM48_Zijuj06G0208800 [Ziziphus jujuba var. spinosa]|uniref:Uncharacterized protein n=1 Tax=Ziziphus jujuba var. spinosa TaxID=714518 RepID=A0A978VBK0_ZIZJJ|nr:hypothetical protein FEM48_Zijuj06G0208800 [Ziziphus jujuba var. spinosa]